MPISLGLGLGLTMLGNTGGGVGAPSWFDWKPAFTISRTAEGFSVSITADDLAPAAGTTLYVSPTGSNSNDGTTTALAKRSIANAYNAGAGTIIAAPGDYTRTNGYEGLTPAARDLTLINSDPDSGSVIIARFEPPTSLTWAQDDTYSNVWHCTRSTAVAVRDRSMVDDNGNIARLAPQTSVTDCSANPGSVYITGSTVNVCLSDEREPDADVLVFLSGANWAFTATMAGTTLWIGEGIEFWGGDTALGTAGLSADDGSRIVATGVKFKYATHATNGEGFAASHLAESYLFSCHAEANELDGFNYHAAGGGTPHALEVDCVGRANGLTGGSNNGSTAHEDYRLIRVNGQYLDNEGPQMIDINTVQSWNLGCTASGGATNFGVLDTAEMTLDSCTSEDATTDLSVGGTGKIYTHALTSGGVFDGTPTPY